MKLIKYDDYERCHVKNLKAGQVLYEDLVVENTLLMKKGGVLTDRIISILRDRNIQYVYIRKEKNFPIMEPISENKLNSMIQQEKLQEEFYEILGLVSAESRYGNVLKNTEEVLLVKNLFIKFMKNPIFYKYWLQIKEYDEYTYRHSMDVFILGTLFCLKELVLNVEEIALGFLFHDIGKLTIPNYILKKNGRLSKSEFLIVQNHTVNGYYLLGKMGLEKVAYLAKYHHERIDGSGYPDGLKGEEQTIELQILHIIDSYSALTLKRPYKDVVPSYVALSMLYDDIHLYNNDLLNRFVDFLGIYPENAHVLLSNGAEAIVEKVHSNFPMLPEVKLYENHMKIELPINLSITIKKILSYKMNSPKVILSKFTDHLIEGNNLHMESYHNKLKNYYQKFEWFTHIYIPTYQVLEIYKSQNTYSKNKLRQGEQDLLKMVNATLVEYCLSHDQKEKALIVLNSQFETTILPKLLQGLLFSEDISSDVMTFQNNDNDLKVVRKIHSFDFNHLIIIGVPMKNSFANIVNQYYFTENQIESFIKKFVFTNLRKVDFIKELEKFKVEGSF